MVDILNHHAIYWTIPISNSLSQTLWGISEVSARETSHRHEPGHSDIPCRREPDWLGLKMEGLGVESKHPGDFRGKNRTTEATIDPHLGHHIPAVWKDLPLPHCQHHRCWHMKQVNYPACVCVLIMFGLVSEKLTAQRWVSHVLQIECFRRFRGSTAQMITCQKNELMQCYCNNVGY